MIAGTVVLLNGIMDIQFHSKGNLNKLFIDFVKTATFSSYLCLRKSMLWFHHGNFSLPSCLHFMSFDKRRVVESFLYIWNKFLLTNIQVGYVFIVSHSLTPLYSISCLLFHPSPPPSIQFQQRNIKRTNKKKKFIFFWDELHVHKLFSLEMLQQNNIIAITWV